jgi:tetratricopeptide (TPR) repeat protein
MSARRRQRRVPTPLTLKDLPFKRLVQEDPDLASIRQEYKDKPARKRFMAAQWEYESSTATALFNQGLTLAQRTTALTFAKGPGPCPGAVLALAIDPTYAPALLTVGSAEYQLGRINEAMELFLALADLPADTEDLVEIIDRVGDFLFDQKDYGHAKNLYEAVVQRHPAVARYHNDLSYCYLKMSQFDRGVACVWKAVELEPNNAIYLSDLGWALVENQEYERAEQVLVRAVQLPTGKITMAAQNLEECRHKMASRRGG